MGRQRESWLGRLGRQLAAPQVSVPTLGWEAAGGRVGRQMHAVGVEEGSVPGPRKCVCTEDVSEDKDLACVCGCTCVHVWLYITGSTCMSAGRWHGTSMSVCVQKARRAGHPCSVPRPPPQASLFHS